MKSGQEFKLNPEQRTAVTYNNGPLLIIAGAGTGKTTVVTEKIKYLIAQGLTKPEEILALTFTEKASTEMEERVDIALPYGTFGLWISTFHAFCDRVLRSEALYIGLPYDFKLMTEAETYLFVKKNFWKFKLNYFRPHGNPYKFIEGLIQHFDRLKDEDVSNESYLNFAKSENEESEKYLELANAYKVYEELKIKESVMDFSDLISTVLNLFRTRNSILQRYKKQFKYILLDEFQDTNLAQYELVKLLAPPAELPNLTAVGDDSQSIYKFRGAAISNILSFMKNYKKAKQVVLTKSYRCPQTVLDASYRLIQKNDPNTLESQLGISKNLVNFAGKKGESIECIVTDRFEDEAEKVIQFIKEYKKESKMEFKDFAILIRANKHSEAFVRALERYQMPYQFLGPGMLFQRPEIKDLIAYLKVLYDFTDSVSLYRVLSMDIWNLNARDIIALINLAKKSNISLFEQLEKIQEVSLINTDSKNKLISFVEMVHEQQKQIAKESAGQILYYFLEDSGILKKIIDYKSQQEEKKALNITKFFDKIKSFEASHEDASVFAVVDYLDLAMSMGESPLAAEVDWTENNAINILTIHSAKGLEFPVVILPNLVEGRFPSRERRDKIPIPDELIKEILPEGDYHLQEERRLFYVGLTRAKQKLILSAAHFYGEGKRERKPSPFIGEALGQDWKTNLLISATTSQIPLFEWSKKEKIESDLQVTTKSKTVIDYLSYSAIETFKICPLHFKLRYILRLSTPPSVAQSMGNSVHNALRDYYVSSKINQLKNKSDQRDFLWKLLEKNWIRQGYTSKQHQQESLEQAKKYLEAYLNTALHQTANPKYLEKSFSFRIDPSLKILGKFDRIDDLGEGNVEVIDYKTGLNIPSKREVDQNLQMTLYALAASQSGILGINVDKIKLSFYFFDTSTIISTVRTKQQLEDSKKNLIRIRDEIRESDFRCSKGVICENCEYKMFCNEY